MQTSAKEELVYELFRSLTTYRLMGSDNIHLRVLRELADSATGEAALPNL